MEDFNYNEFNTYIKSINNKSIADKLTYIFNIIDDFLLSGQYNIINDLLLSLNINYFDANILVGILTITFPFKNKLENRKLFLEKSFERIRKMYNSIEAEEILNGLE